MKQAITLFGIFLLTITASYAQQTEQRTRHFNLSKGLAIEGYDPVAYFTEGKAVEGKKENNTLVSWNKDEAGLKTKADANWKKIAGL